MGRRRAARGRRAATPTGILARGRGRRARRCVVGGVDPDDLPDPVPRARRWRTPRSWSAWSCARSAVTDRADVVLPVAPSAEKAGTFLDWEGRGGPFDAALESTGHCRDLRVLHRLAERMDVDLGLPDVRRARASSPRLGAWRGARARGARRWPPAPAARRSRARPCSPPGTCCSTTAGCRTASRTSRAPRKPAGALVSAATAAEVGVATAAR